MHSNAFDEKNLEPEIFDFYSRVIAQLEGFGLPYLVGGGCAYGLYSGIVRDTKDLDIFIEPKDVYDVMSRFAAAGFQTEITDDLWLAKVFYQGHYVDVIFGFRNAIAKIDRDWFYYARPSKLFDRCIKLVPPEELLWSKCFIATRERYDGADIAHLLLGQAEQLDWRRLLDRFGEHWRLLYGHLIFFGYIYPEHQHLIPSGVLADLAARLEGEEALAAPSEPVCRGPLLSATDYVTDTTQWGMIDPTKITGGSNDPVRKAPD